MIGEHCLEFSRVLFFFLSCCYNVIFSVSWIIWNGFSFSGGFLKHLSPPSETFEPNYSAVCWTPFVSSCGFYRKWGKGNIANSCQIKLCRPGELLINAASDLFNSSGCQCPVGLLHLLFQGLACRGEVWDRWIIYGIYFPPDGISALLVIESVLWDEFTCKSVGLWKGQVQRLPQRNNPAEWKWRCA